MIYYVGDDTSILYYNKSEISNAYLYKGITGYYYDDIGVVIGGYGNFMGKTYYIYDIKNETNIDIIDKAIESICLKYVSNEFEIFELLDPFL